MNDSKRMLDLAARLALRGFGMVEPNPMVGAVLVRDGTIIGLGHHRKFGGLHAEREALADCRRRGIDPRGSTVYVTLEPCNGHGKQPPCTEALIQAGVVRVIAARSDPNPGKSGGAARLRAAGIECEFSADSLLASGLASAFIKRLTRGLPWVIAKWAQTLDGKIATRSGESKWISGEPARRRVHRLRAKVDAILTGIGTVRADDPMLTARGVSRLRRVAARVVVDARLEIPLDSALVKSAREVPVIVAGEDVVVNGAGGGAGAAKAAELRKAGVEVEAIPPGPRGIDLRALLRVLLEKHGVGTVMVEAGPRVLGGLFEENLIDLAVVHLAAMVVGDERARSVAEGRVVEALTGARILRVSRVKRVGQDLEIMYRRIPERGDGALGP